jgi:hypothetical protein
MVQPEEGAGPIDLIARINNLQVTRTRPVGCDQALQERQEENEKEEENEENEELEKEEEETPRVAEMARMFGGTRRRCLQSIRSNLSLGKARVREGEAGEEARTKESRAKEAKAEEPMTREPEEAGRPTGCRPLLVFLATPFLVLLLAWLLHCWSVLAGSALHCIAMRICVLPTALCWALPY